MSDALKTILAFVEGQIDAKPFEAALYADLPAFEQLLDQTSLPRSHYAWPSVYLSVIEQDFDDPGGVLNAHGALSQYLKDDGVSFKPISVYEDFFQLLLTAQPGSLALDTRYLKELTDEAGGLTGEELKEWLHAELLKRFCYLKEPPLLDTEPGMADQ